MENLELQSVCKTLSEAPFNKAYSVLELCYKLSADEYIKIIYALISWINQLSARRGSVEVSSASSSVWKNDVWTVTPEAGCVFLTDLLTTLRFKSESEEDRLFDVLHRSISAAISNSELVSADRAMLVRIVEFLSKGLPIHSKRLRLATFLRPMNIPQEFAEDEKVSQLVEQLKSLQEEFKQLDQHVERQREAQEASLELKQTIKQLELEKQQVALRINSEQVKVQGLPQYEAWLSSARRNREAFDKRDQSQQLWTEHEQKNVALSAAVAEKKQLLQSLQFSETLPEALRHIQAQLREKKGIDDQLKSLQTACDDLTAMIAKKQRMLDNQVNSDGVTMGDDAFTLYIQEHRALAQEYKSKASELKALKAHKQELQNDLSTRRTQSDNVLVVESSSKVDSKLSDILENYRLSDIERDLKQALDSYNNKKAAVFALDNEASKLELKLKQARAQEREVKKGLDSNGVNLELEVEQLTQKMNAINSQVDSEQSMAFNSQQKLEILEQQLQTLEDEENAYRGKVDKRLALIHQDRGFKTHQQYLTKAISDAEKSLKHEQSEYENEKTLLQSDHKQIDYFRGLVKLFKIKATLQEASLKQVHSRKPISFGQKSASSTKPNTLIL